VPCFRPLSSTPGAKSHLSRAASSGPRLKPPIPSLPACFHQNEPLWRRAPSGQVEVKANHQPCRGVSASTVHGQSTAPLPRHSLAPKARQGTQLSSTRLLTNAPCPIRRLTAGQNSQPACPAPSPLDLLFVPSIYIPGLLAPFTLVVTQSFNPTSVSRYRHFTTHRPSRC